MLISKSDIAKYREVSTSVRDKKINPHIDDAEFLDLRPLLGRDLYQDMVANSADVKYVALMAGGSYTYKDKTYNHPGLEKVLSLFAYARYIVHGGFTDTAFGFVEKSDLNSAPVSATSKRDIYTKDRDAAMQYWFEVQTFLNRSTDTYPLWENNCLQNRGAVRFSKITLD